MLQDCDTHTCQELSGPAFAYLYLFGWWPPDLGTSTQNSRATTVVECNQMFGEVAVQGGAV